MTWEQETCPTCGANDCDAGEICDECQEYEDALDGRGPHEDPGSGRSFGGGVWQVGGEPWQS